MTNLTRYTAADLPALMEKINKYSIGMDEYFDMSTRKMVNFLLKVRKRIKKRKPIISTRVWLNGHLHEHGRSLTTRKFDQLILRMGF